MASKEDWWAMDLGGLDKEDVRWESFLLALPCSFTAVSISITDSVAGSFFHSANMWASGPKRSLSPIDITMSLPLSLWGRSTPAVSRTMRRRSICKCVKSSPTIIAESCDKSCASMMVEFILSKSKCSVGAISSIFPGQQQTGTWGWFSACKKLPELWMKDSLNERHELRKPWTRRSVWWSQESGTCSTTVEVGGLSMTGESSYCSQPLGKVEGTLMWSREVFRWKLLVPVIGYRWWRPRFGRRTRLGLLVMLVKAQPLVYCSLWHLDDRPQDMELLLSSL